MTSVRGGLLPSSITIGLPFSVHKRSGPLEFGWEPDGSRIIWHNRDEANRKVKIESVSINYQPLNATRSEDTGQVVEPKSVSMFEIWRETKMQFAALQADLKAVKKTFSFAIAVFVLAAIYFAIRHP